MSGTKAGAAKRRMTQPAPPAAATEGRAESRPEVTPEVLQEFIDLGAEHGPNVTAPVYVVGPKRVLLHKGKKLNAGEVVPGAHLWPRIQSWISTGRIVEKT